MGEFIPAPAKSKEHGEIALQKRRTCCWYETYLQDMEGASDPPVCESYFYDLWNTHSTFWKARTVEEADKLGGWTWTVETRSSRTRGIHKCDICCESSEHLREKGMDVNTTEWRTYKENHLGRVRGTRDAYAQNKMDGRPVLLMSNPT